MSDGIVLKKACLYCEVDFLIIVPLAGMKAWDNGAFIQDAFPDMDMGTRELLISGTCGSCFDAMIEDGDEEYEDVDFHDVYDDGF